MLTPGLLPLMMCKNAIKKARASTENFDQQFTQLPPELTIIKKDERLFLMNVDQSIFAKFDYCNPEFVIHC